MATEQELRSEWQQEAKQQTLETLPAFLTKLAAHEHDYGSICVAIGAAAVAAAWAIEKSPSGGITGFQAGAVFWEFTKGWGSPGGEFLRMQAMENLCYPQYDYKWNTISDDQWRGVQEFAMKKLETGSEHMHPDVRARLESIVAGHLPCGFTIKN